MLTTPSAKARRAWRVTAWAGAAAVLVISLLPLEVPSALVPTGTDKLVHASLYALLAYCYARAYARRTWPALGFALMCYGGSIELLQALTSTRTASLPDALANSAGISIMLAALWRLSPPRPDPTAGGTENPDGYR